MLRVVNSFRVARDTTVGFRAVAERHKLKVLFASEG